MGSIHLDFSEDRLPGSETHNQEAYEDFDWPSVFAEADGVMEEARESLSAHDFQAMGEALGAILRSLLAGSNNAQRPWAEAVGRRCIALAFTVNQELLHGVKAYQLAQELRTSKQNFGERQQHVMAFLLKHPARRTKVSRLPMGGASAPNTDENRDTATDCSQSAGAGEAPELERDDDSAQDSCGGTPP